MWTTCFLLVLMIWRGAAVILISRRGGQPFRGVSGAFLSIGMPDTLWPFLPLAASLFNYAAPSPWYARTHSLLLVWILLEIPILLLARHCAKRMPQEPPEHGEALAGCLLGTAAGDSIGLPYERLTPRTIARILPENKRLEQNLLFRFGTVSDDTEQTAILTSSLYRCRTAEPAVFLRDWARAFRRWTIWNPWTSGRASLLSGLKLLAGCPPSAAGIFSAGNAPVMRSAVIGVCFADDADRRRMFVRTASRLTHTDPRAEIAAQAAASIAAALTLRKRGEILSSAETAAILRAEGAEDAEWLALVEKMESAMSDASLPIPLKFSERRRQNMGVSGYCFDTAAASFLLWFRHQGDFASCIEAAVRQGGDTDTTAAIVGALAGIQSGVSAIPALWLRRISAYPYSPRFLQNLASDPLRPVVWFPPFRLADSLLLFLVLFANVLKRAAFLRFRLS